MAKKTAKNKVVTNSIGNEIRELQKDIAKRNLKIFAETYFPHYCTFSFAPFHLELFNHLDEITINSGRQLAIAAPRGNAKSSIVTLIYTLWCICCGHVKCIVLVSSTRPQSEKLLSHIKDELSSNDKLKQDFSEVCEQPTQRQQLESRLEELERISLSQAEIDTIVKDAMNFISGLEKTLREGLPQEKLVALRQCITRISISKPENSVKISMLLVPAGNLGSTQECVCAIAPANRYVS